jgi:hypothetical protein
VLVLRASSSSSSLGTSLALRPGCWVGSWVV